MRVILQTAPVPSVYRQGTKTEDGTAHWSVIVYEADEEVPHRQDAYPVSQWRASVGPGRPIEQAGPPHIPGLGTLSIPAALLDRVPGTSKLVQYNWKAR
jgi:hypothetical protein